MKYLSIILFVIVIAGFFWILKIGIEKQEKLECKEWQKSFQEYPSFYVTDWQIEQCNSYDINLVDYSCDDCW